MTHDPYEVIEQLLGAIEARSNAEARMYSAVVTAEECLERRQATDKAAEEAEEVRRRQMESLPHWMADNWPDAKKLAAHLRNDHEHEVPDNALDKDMIRLHAEIHGRPLREQRHEPAPAETESVTEQLADAIPPEGQSFHLDGERWTTGALQVHLAEKHDQKPGSTRDLPKNDLLVLHEAGHPELAEKQHAHVTHWTAYDLRRHLETEHGWSREVLAGVPRADLFAHHETLHQQDPDHTVLGG